MMARAGGPVGPRLRRLLIVVMVGAAALAANSIYLALVTFLEWVTGRPLQNYFYQYMFLAHLALGLLINAFLLARVRRSGLQVAAFYWHFVNAATILLVLTQLSPAL